jgi:cytochrome c oxidase subunit III
MSGHGGSSGPGGAGGSGTSAAEETRHPKFLAHHFATPRQQYESGKTGMWLFLSTEILLFSGLFCAYAVYRANHPEIFIYAHRYLDKTLGGINTLVLILSSLTAAWAVRAAQLNQRRRLIGLIVATLVCACCFLGIKAVEYEHKWKHGLLWGKRFRPELIQGADEKSSAAAPTASMVAALSPAASTPAKTTQATSGAAPGTAVTTGSELNIHSNIAPAAAGPAGLARGPARSAVPEESSGERPKNVQIFFGIYFVMTGLHALHVIAGMITFLWVLSRAIRGDFSSEYFTPVDLAALYWHLVDVIWIYLFPLLYLIH